jgi:hypothetical protein
MPDPHLQCPDAIAVVRTWDPAAAAEAAWATGCNPGGTVAFNPLTTETVEKAGVEPFTLITGPAIFEAVAAINRQAEAEASRCAGVPYQPPDCDSKPEFVVGGIPVCEDHLLGQLRDWLARPDDEVLVTLYDPDDSATGKE